MRIAVAAALLFLLTPSLAYAQEVVLDTQVNMKAEVLSVEVSEVRDIPGTDTPATYQTITVKVLDGPEKGRVVTVENDYLELAVGDVFYLTHTTSLVGDYDRYSVSEPYRLPVLLLLVGLFLVVVFVFGGWQGLRGLAALAVSLLAIFFLLLPGILHGYSPVLLAVGVASVIVVLGSYVTHGFNKTTSAAVIGMLLTIVVTGALAYFVVAGAQLSGFSSDESVYLNFNTRGAIDLVGLLLGGMLIGLLGVLYDAAIGQAVSVEEMARLAPHVSRRHIYTRALRIGREHIGALVNTLAIAYVGVSLPLLLLFYFSESSLMFIINREVFATEIVRTMVGSIGLVLAVPITTAIAVLMLMPKTAGQGSEEVRAKERESLAHVGHHHHHHHHHH